MASSHTGFQAAMLREERQLDRLTFFSDAVFAIAMTLLVVDVRLPHLPRVDDHALAQALVDLIPNYIGFLVSFLVLSRFWAGHHVVFGLLKAASPKLIWTNLILLLAVAFMPFPTAVISEYAQTRVAIGFYAGWLVLLGLLNRRLVGLAADPALLADDVDPAIFRGFRRASLIPLLIGGGALVFGMVAPVGGMAMLVIGSPIVSWVLRRRS